MWNSQNCFCYCFWTILSKQFTKLFRNNKKKLVLICCKFLANLCKSSEILKQYDVKWLNYGSVSYSFSYKMSTIVHSKGVGGQICPRSYWMPPQRPQTSFCNCTLTPKAFLLWYFRSSQSKPLDFCPMSLKKILKRCSLVFGQKFYEKRPKILEFVSILKKIKGAILRWPKSSISPSSTVH